MIKIQDELYFSSDNEDMDFQMIFDFLKDSYWGSSRTFDEQKLAFDNSINLGLFKGGKQIAYTRVMTDMVLSDRAKIVYE